MCVYVFTQHGFINVNKLRPPPKRIVFFSFFFFPPPPYVIFLFFFLFLGRIFHAKHNIIYTHFGCKLTRWRAPRCYLARYNIFLFSLLFFRFFIRQLVIRNIIICRFFLFNYNKGEARHWWREVLVKYFYTHSAAPLAFSPKPLNRKRYRFDNDIHPRIFADYIMCEIKYRDW